jgi:hypothetical protein
MPKKTSACRTEVRVVYHCEIGNKCDFFLLDKERGVCTFLRTQDSVCTLRAAQRAGRKAARQRA